MRWVKAIEALTRAVPGGSCTLWRDVTLAAHALQQRGSYFEAPRIGRRKSALEVSSRGGAISRSYQTTELPDKPTASLFSSYFFHLIIQLRISEHSKRLRCVCLSHPTKVLTLSLSAPDIVKVTSPAWIAKRSYLLPESSTSCN